MIARPTFIFGTLFDAIPTDADPTTMTPRLPELVEALPGVDSPETKALFRVFRMATSDSGVRGFGILAGIVSAMFGAAAMLTIRKLAGKAHSYHVVTSFHFLTIPFVAIMMIIMPSAIDTHTWVFPSDLKTLSLLCAASYGGLIAQILVGLALEREKASKAMTMNYIQAVFAFFGEWLVWGIVPHWMSLLGGLLVIVCVFSVAFMKK